MKEMEERARWKSTLDVGGGCSGEHTEPALSLQGHLRGKRVLIKRGMTCQVCNFELFPRPGSDEKF
jgi:hypothetical protein